MIIWNGVAGGLSDSRFSGVEGSFYKSIGIDWHDSPGLLKIHQKLTKNSGATVDAFCRVKVEASNGYTFWFSYTSGKIWARTNGGSWSLAYTTTPAAGNAGCLGAMEYNGVIYWATQSRLHKISIADADASWASVTEDFGTFDVTDTEFHPMATQDLTLFGGDGNQVWSVDLDGTFDSNALDIKTPLRIKAMVDYELDILIGTIVADNVNKTEIIRWDTVSPSWNTSDTIEEMGIHAFIRDDNFMYVQAGLRGNIYFYNGEQLEQVNRIPGDYSNVKFGEVYPGSHANFGGRPVFGFSNSPDADNSVGNPTEQGVYTLGSYGRNYLKVMDLSWVISQDDVTNVEIGAIAVVDHGYTLLVAWKEGSNYGVDKLDYSAKYAGAYVETMMLAQDKRDVLKTLRKVSALYETLPSGTSITFSYKINHGSYVVMTSVDDTILQEVFAELDVGEIGALQIKVSFGVSSNDAPTVEALAMELT